MHHIPEYMMWTVPHSGTRYTKTAFERAGLRCQHGYRWAGVDRDKPDLLWGHVDPDHLFGELGLIASCVSKEFLVTRNPIDVWTTWMIEPHEHVEFDEPVGAAMFALERHWEAQRALVKRELHIHRVDKDSLKDLGMWAGLELADHSSTFTAGVSPLKAAVQLRDEQAIEAAIKGSGAWKRFKRDAEVYGDLYKELGYDLWWING